MPVVVSVADSATVWFEIEAEIAPRLPLKGVTWLQNGRTQRLIETLDIQFVPFRVDMFPRVVPGTATPFSVHLLLVNAEDPELYKSQIKKQISDWLGVVANKKSQEHCVVYFTNPNKKDGQRGILNMGGSVSDRIKSDFSGKTNILILKPVHPKDPSIWNEFFAKLRELILNSFNMKLAVYEEDIRRLDSQRLLPGWNYCQFFIMKDGSACTYEFLNVIEEALLQYDELEAAFFQNLLEQGAPWFQSFGGSEAGDDSASVLSLTRKPYHDMILQNTVSIFDFRIYLFARQINLLFKTPNGAVEACTRAKKFISSFARTLREYSAGLTPYFMESWIFSACMSVVTQCDEQAAVAERTNMTAYEGVKAELLHYARLQLDILGDAAGLITSSIHKIPAREESTEVVEAGVPPKAPHECVTNHDLKKALQTAEAFDALYLSLSNRAIKSFEASQRARTTLILKGDMAALHFHRQRYTEAIALWMPVTSNTRGERWEAMDRVVLDKLVVCLRELNRPADGPALTGVLLRLLDHCARVDRNAADEYAGLLNGVVAAAAEEPATGEGFEGLGMFKVHPKRFMNRVGNEQAHELEVVVESFLGVDVNVKEVRATLMGKEEQNLICKAEGLVVKPGMNLMRLKCEPVTTAGLYTVEKTMIAIGSKLITYETPRNRLRKSTFEVKGQVDSFDFHARFLPSFDDTSKRTKRVLLIRIGSKITFPTSATLSIIPISLASVPPLTTVQFKTTKSDKVIKDHDMAIQDRLIEIPTFAEEETVSCLIPISVDKNSADMIEIKFVIAYTNATGAKSTFTRVKKLRQLPAIKCEHRMIPHGSGTLIQIKLIGNSKVPLRLNNVSLSGLSGFKITSFCNFDNDVIFEDHTLSLVYHLEPDGETAKKGVLNLKYHNLLDEISCYLSARLSTFLESKGKLNYSRFLSLYLHQLIVENRDPEILVLTGHLDLPTLDVIAFQQAISTEDEGVVQNLAGLLDDFIGTVKELTLSDVAEYAKESGSNLQSSVLPYAFEVCQYQVVLAATIEPALKESGSLVGDSIPCKLEIVAKFWSDSASDNLEAVYEVKFSEASWLLSGLKRHRFSLNKVEEFVTTFDLIPVSAGKLLLPNVEVFTFTGGVQLYCGYPSSEEVMILPRESATLFVPFGPAPV